MGWTRYCPKTSIRKKTPSVKGCEQELIFYGAAGHAICVYGLNELYAKGGRLRISFGRPALETRPDRLGHFPPRREAIGANVLPYWKTLTNEFRVRPGRIELDMRGARRCLEGEARASVDVEIVGHCKRPGRGRLVRPVRPVRPVGRGAST